MGRKPKHPPEIREEVCQRIAAGELNTHSASDWLVGKGYPPLGHASIQELYDQYRASGNMLATKTTITATRAVVDPESLIQFAEELAQLERAGKIAETNLDVLADERKRLIDSDDQKDKSEGYHVADIMRRYIEAIGKNAQAKKEIKAMYATAVKSLGVKGMDKTAAYRKGYEDGSTDARAAFDQKCNACGKQIIEPKDEDDDDRRKDDDTDGVQQPAAVEG